ncbi:C40 family peptidase [Rhodohalobacter sp. 8-1]|uniref:C40 family peptidase n=1 Tax=Rhodohalobacter sp. 8-1 TaxID=3131972 RepID=UPI0030EC770C
MCTQVIFDFVTPRNALLFALFLILSSCGVVNEQRVPQQATRTAAQESHVLDALNQAHNNWRGTPYVLGGAGMGGVDCSSFTQIVFKDYFGIELPRNTRQQLQEGTSVRRNYTRPGDLVFFKTGRNMLHVGIIMKGDRFLHASVSSGVMISNIGQRYWATKYLGTRRIL